MKAIPPRDSKLLAIRQGQDNPLDFISWSFDRMIEPWVPSDTSRTVLHIGPGIKSVEGEAVLDYPDFDFDGQMTIRPIGEGHRNHTVDWKTSGRDPIPLQNDSVGGIFAVCVLEHLYDISWIIREGARVLAPGCPFNIFVPHPESVMHYEDADHKSRQVLDSWENLLNNPYYGEAKGKNGIPLRVGFNMKVALKEENTAIATQLIKMTYDEALKAEFEE